MTRQKKTKTKKWIERVVVKRKVVYFQRWN